MNDAWNHALLVISLFIAWTIAVAYMGGKKVLLDYWDVDSTTSKE